jgi:hypothetical protein
VAKISASMSAGVFSAAASAFRAAIIPRSAELCPSSA